MRLFHVCTATLLLALFTYAPKVHAVRFSFDYLALGYDVLEYDIAAQNFRQGGYHLNLSYALSEHFFVQGFYAQLDGPLLINDSTINVKNNQWRLAGGWQKTLHPSANVFVSAAMERNRQEFRPQAISNTDEDRSSLEFGVRYHLMSTLEINASTGYVMNEQEDDISYNIGAMVDLADNVHIGFTIGEALNRSVNRVFFQLSF